MQQLEDGRAGSFFDARESRLYQFYMGYKRGKVASGSETAVQGREVGAGYAEGFQGLDDVLFDGGGEAPNNKLKATTRARIEALSEYLSRIIAADKRVIRFRDRVLGGPWITLSPEVAGNLLRSLAAKQQPGSPRDVETLWWPGNDETTQAEPITVWPGSGLWHLKDLCRKLARFYLWSEDQVCYLILTGRPIRAPPLRGRVLPADTGVAAHRYQRNTINLEIDAWMPSEYVRRVYNNIQRDLLGENNRQPELRNVEVFRFVVARSKLQVVNAGERLAKLAIPEWKKLRELWNEQYPAGHKWHYHKKKEHRFSRDFYRGQEALICTQHGLPGGPHQPMTAAEARERLRNILDGSS